MKRLLTLTLMTLGLLAQATAQTLAISGYGNTQLRSSITYPLEGDVLTYIRGNWVNRALFAGSGSDTTEVATSLVSGFLKYSDWGMFNAKVGTSRTISGGYGITGGGDFSADRTLASDTTGAQATGNRTGYLFHTDWNTFNNKVGTPTTISTGYGITGGGDLSTNRTHTADTTNARANTTRTGHLFYADWNTFNNKVSSVTAGNTFITTGGSATAPTILSDTTKAATTAVSGFLRFSDFVTFNNKVTSVAAGNTFITMGGTATAPTLLSDTTKYATTSVSGFLKASDWFLFDSKQAALGTANLLGLNSGGTNANLTASNGGILWSNASQVQILAGTATANKMLLSGATATPSWSTSTIPTSAGATAGKVLLSDGTNYILSTPTYPNAAPGTGTFPRGDATNFVTSTLTIPNASTTGDVFVSTGTSAMGVVAVNATANKMLLSGASAIPTWSTSTIPTSAGATANKHLISDGTNYVLSAITFPNTSPAAGTFPRGDATNFITSTLTLPNAATTGDVLVATGTNAVGVVAVQATANKVLMSGASAVPTWSTPTYPNAATPTAGKLIIADGTNWIARTPTIPNTSGTVGQYLVSDGTNNVYGSGVGQASIVAASSAINTTETIIVKTAALAAGRLLAGTIVRITLTGTCTSTAANVSTFRIRIGTAGTTSDGVVHAAASSVAATSGTSIPFRIVMEMTIRTTGASATTHGFTTLINTGVTGISAVNAQVILPTFTAFNTTTANNIISASYVSAATTTTCTFQNAFIEFVYQ